MNNNLTGYMCVFVHMPSLSMHEVGRASGIELSGMFPMLLSSIQISVHELLSMCIYQP